jgi:cysteine desulfurase/selenocysteine lyase
MKLDVQAIRNDFPILSRQVHGKDLIYLDNAATTQKPTCVVQQIVASYYTTNANIHRGVHTLSQESTSAHEQARQKVQAFIGAEHAHEVIFTSGTTEAINLVASSFCYAFMQEGDEVIISEMEHHSNIVPWQIQAARTGIAIKIAPVTDSGELDMEAYRALFSARTKLVSITHVSNVLGTVNPVEEIIAIAHANNARVLIDGAQAVAHTAVDVQAMDADFYAFSAHKLYGPTGVGVLYAKEYLLDALPPYQGGGEMIASVTFGQTNFNDLPYKFEAGTPNYIGAIAFARALEYVESFGINNIAAYEDELLQYASQRLNEIEGMRIFGTAAHKSGVISFLVNDIHPYDLGLLLDRLGIGVRTGHHCAEPLMHRLGIEGTVRASFAFYNTKEEIDTFVAGVKRVVSMF